MAVLMAIAIASSCEEGQKFHPDGGHGGLPAVGPGGGIDAAGGARMGSSGGAPAGGGGSGIAPGTGGNSTAGSGGVSVGAGGSAGNFGSGAGTGSGSGGSMGTGGYFGTGGMASGGGGTGGTGSGGRTSAGGTASGGSGLGGRIGTGGAGTGGAGGKPGSGGVIGTGGAMAACQSGATQCMAGNLQTCGSNGQWGAATSCGTHRACTGQAGTAQCTCNVDPVCNSVGTTCSGTTAVANCAMDGNGCFYQASSMACASGTSCSGGKCGCAQGLTPCNGVCVDLQTDPKNCGACGENSCSTKSMGCSKGQCVCATDTPNGLEICNFPGQARGTCWNGACVLPALGVGCSSASDCVPGGCSPTGYCLGTVELAGQVSCSDTNGPTARCPAAQGCTDVGGRAPPFAVCGDGGTGAGAITCDGANDCPSNNDCCALVGTQHCYPQSTAGVIGSGCAALNTNPNAPQAALVCDPLNPMTSCPGGKSCVAQVGSSLVINISCQ